MDDNGSQSGKNNAKELISQKTNSESPLNSKSERIPTGIAGLDDILGGGLPQGHLYLVEGDPGTGKNNAGAAVSS
jgi:predicted ATP-dependent serine protease